MVLGPILVSVILAGRFIERRADRYSGMARRFAVCE